MAPATVYFCHGKESGPWGLKIRVLARVAERLRCRVVSLDDQGVDDPGQRIRHLLDEAASADGPLVLAGSSMGGYVAAVASETLRPRGLFLMAPAIGVPGYPAPTPEPSAGEMMIVHGWHDDVVPLEPVFRFAQARSCPLCVLPDRHDLREQVDALERLFADFLARCLGDECGAGAGRRLLGTL